MEVRKVNSFNNAKVVSRQYVSNTKQDITFKAAPSNGSNGAKKGWLALRRLADAMKDITEQKNAYIAAIGTGVIAPVVIMASPGKGDKEDKNKKFIQALRQPLSAVLAVIAQVPMTTLITRAIEKQGYSKKETALKKLFNDHLTGELIPTEKYLARNVSSEELRAWEAKFEQVVDGKSLKQELEEEIRTKEYKEVGLEVSDEELAKRVKKGKEKFLRTKIAKEKFEKLKAEKVQDIIKNPSKYPKLADIKDIDLVTEDDKMLAEHRFNAEYKKLEADAKLSPFDKTMRAMGLETKKLKQLDAAQKAFKKEKGLEILKNENPEIFKDYNSKIKAFVEAYQKDSEKFFSNKQFWLSLLVNLFMVGVSCYALNWVHPRVNKMLEEKFADKDSANIQKGEVK